jgi:TRAP-type C4-dicarboxylate transport system permease small subunit
MLGKLNSRIESILSFLLVVLFTLLVFDVLWGVATRYLLGGQARWTEELARFLMVWLGLLGAALVCREEEHLGLDLLVRNMDPVVEKWARLFVHLSVGGFAIAVMTWGGGELVLHRLEAGQVLPALGISKAWFYLAIPISGLLIALFVTELAFGVIREIRRKEES